MLALGVLVQNASVVDLRAEVEIKKFYMAIWKLFYFEYLILLVDTAILSHADTNIDGKISQEEWQRVLGV